MISLTPVEPARWDVAGHVGWFASDKSDIGAEWDDWYNSLSGGVSAGRYLTPHVKTEIHAAVSGEGRIYSEDLRPLPLGFPIVFRPREHYFRTTTVGAGLAYQLFENQWFHPFVGGGLEVLREHHRVDIPRQFAPVPLPPTVPGLPTVTRDPLAPFLVVQEVAPPPQVTYEARPFVTTGFKWYVAERAFLRTSIQASFSRRGTAHVTWAAGIGADL